MVAIKAVVAGPSGREYIYRDRTDLPGDGKRRDDLVADLDRFDGRAGLDDGADKLVAHDEAGRGLLEATENMQLSGMARESVRVGRHEEEGGIRSA